MEERREQKIARFIAGVHPDIKEKIELQPNLTFEEVCNSAVIFDKQRRKNVAKGVNKSFTNKSYSSPVKTSDNKTGDKKACSSTEKGKSTDTIKDGTPKVTCFKCKGVGHYKRDCPTNRVMTMREVREIHALTGVNDSMDETDEEDEIVTSSEEECKSETESDNDGDGQTLVLR